MPRMTAGKRSELESFWRAHLGGWRRSELNLRASCSTAAAALQRGGQETHRRGDMPRGCIGLGRGEEVWHRYPAVVLLEAGTGTGGEDRDVLPARNADGCTG